MMTKTASLAAIAVCYILLSLVQCGAEEVRILSLRDAVNMALGTASPYQKSLLTEEMSRQEIELGKSRLKPTLEAQVGTLYTSSSLNPTTPSEPSFLGANAIFENKALLVLQGEIDISGRLHAGIDKSRALCDAASAQSSVARLDLVQSVGMAYLDATFAVARREAACENLDAAQQFRDTTQDRYLAGEVARVDVLKADLQIGLARDQAEQALSLENTSRESLFSLLHLDPESRMELTPLTGLLPEDKQSECLDVSLERRPELNDLEAQRQATEADLRMAAADMKPRLTYTLRSGLLTDSFSGSALSRHVGMEGQIAISFPLFDGGASAVKQEQAKLKLSQIENDNLLLQRQIRTERLNALNKARSGQQRFQELGSQLETAKESLAISKARYAMGEAPVVEVLDAQNSLASISQAYNQAAYDYLTAQIEYQRALGVQKTP